MYLPAYVLACATSLPVRPVSTHTATCRLSGSARTTSTPRSFGGSLWVADRAPGRSEAGAATEVTISVRLCRSALRDEVVARFARSGRTVLRRPLMIRRRSMRQRAAEAACQTAPILHQRASAAYRRATCVGLAVRPCRKALRG
jgi:hypothetical protein